MKILNRHSDATKAGLLFAAVFLPTMFFVFKNNSLPKEKQKTEEKNTVKTIEENLDSISIGWMFENSYADSIKVLLKYHQKSAAIENQKKLVDLTHLLYSQGVFCDESNLNLDSIKTLIKSIKIDNYSVGYSILIGEDKFYDINLEIDEKNKVVKASKELIYDTYYVSTFSDNKYTKPTTYYRGNIKTKCK